MADSTMSEIITSFLLVIPVMFCFICLVDFVVETVWAVYNDVLQFFTRCRRAMVWSMNLMLFILTVAFVKVFAETMKDLIEV
ncbi:hypothetical protein LZL87_013907 [Fusarium oxysporum]|nr:hypothetical protein LZL87_013907 [Fusarium oxysporum]